jgi:hypothetical protein
MFQSNNMIKVTIKVKTMETIGEEHQPSDGRRNYNNCRWDITKAEEMIINQNGDINQVLVQG